MTSPSAAIGLCLLAGAPVALLTGTPAAVFALLTSTILAFGGALSCAIAARRSAGHARAGWALLGLACLSWGTGNAYWSHNELIRHAEVLFPSLGDIGFILFPLAAGAGLLLIPGRSEHLSRFTSLLDGLIVVTALFIGAWGLTLRDVWHAGGDTVLAFLVAIAYPIGDLVLATMAVLLAARTRRGNRTELVLLIGGLLGMTASDVLFALATADGSYSSGAASDAGWVIAFAAFAMAGWTSARRPAATPAPDRPLAGRTGRVPRWQLVLPYAPFGIAAIVCVGQVLLGDPMDGPQSVALLVGVCLVLARQLVTIVCNSALTEQLRFQAYHDPLTGLGNRTLFNVRMERMLQTGAPTVLYLDLDDFKLVNDNLGHDAGDDLLRGVAARLRNSFPEAAAIARLGGDEFAVLIPRGRPAVDAERLLAGLRRPFAVGPHTVAVTGSVGAAEARRGETEAEDLRKHVDLAMYAAKGRGKNAYAVFEPAMRRTFDAEMALREELRAALRDAALSVVYQPIVDLRDGSVRGLEALVRWRHPVRGEISPATFIPVAERAAMIADIGQFVLGRACAEFAAWSGAADGYLSVNVSPLQLLDPAFTDRVVDTVRRHGLRPSQLVLEITEEALADESYVIPALGRLRAAGLRIAIDDFGTGYSSLRYLHRFPVDIVKIDRSYVADIGANPADARLVQTLWQLFSALGLSAVAEGVEDAAQARLLAEMGCPLAQGYLFGRPVPMRDLPVAQPA